MTFRVWRYGAGDGPGGGGLIDAWDHEAAAALAHERMDEPDSNEVFFVQATEGDRKVRVVCSELQYEPSAYGRVQDTAVIKARCTQCRRRQLDEVTILVGGLCQACRNRQYLKELAR